MANRRRNFRRPDWTEIVAALLFTLGTCLALGPLCGCVNRPASTPTNIPSTPTAPHQVERVMYARSITMRKTNSKLRARIARLINVMRDQRAMHMVAIDRIDTKLKTLGVKPAAKQSHDRETFSDQT